MGFDLMLMAMLSLVGSDQSREPPRRDPPAQERAAPAQRPETVYFANCAAARAAGRQNIRRGEPGYRRALDRDNDGVACESR